MLHFVFRRQEYNVQPRRSWLRLWSELARQLRRYIDTSQKPVALLRDWLTQILPYRSTLQQSLQKKTEEGANVDLMGPAELWELLKAGLETVEGRVYCVVNALDEIDDGELSFLDDLSDFASFRPDKICILATSRPVSGVTDMLR